MQVIHLHGLNYHWPKQTQATLNISELSVQQGEHLFLQGESGSGKTTLLNILCGILPIQQGSIRLLGQNLSEMTAAQRDRFRADHMGVVFQQFNLLPYLSVVDNILLPCHFSPRRKQQAGNLSETVAHLLAQLQLDEKLQQKSVTELSVGQQQRVAVARALIGKPEIIIADEPTSALDTRTRNRFLDLLFSEASSQNSTIVFVSHDPYIAERFPDVQELAVLNKAAKIAENWL